MVTYKYTAIDQQGTPSTGEVEATDDHQAADILRGKKLLITSLELKREISFLDSLNGSNKASGKDIALYTRQLSTMVNAGLPLTQSLEILSKQTKSKGLQKALREVIHDIDGGLPLHKTLEKHPTIFPRLYTSLIKAGEASGNLDKILLQLADGLESQEEFNGKIKGAMIYPIIIVLAMVGVLTMMMVFVVPQMKGVYESLDAELPIQTKALVWFSDFMVSRWYVLIGIVGAIYYAYRSYAATLQGRYVLTDLKSKIPIFGKLGNEVQLTSFVKTMALLIASGVPILDAIDISRETMSNIRYQEAVATIGNGIEKGLSLSDAFARQPIFPTLMSQMVAIGESTGKLDEVLTKVGHTFEQETNETVKNLTTALEPLIMIFLGVSVGFLIFALITPIYGLLSNF
jgi:type IV pilus assembly protein PilC